MSQRGKLKHKRERAAELAPSCATAPRYLTPAETNEKRKADLKEAADLIEA